MFERPRMKEKVEGDSTFKFTCGLPFTASTLFMHVKLNHATKFKRAHFSGNFQALIKFLR